MESYLEGGMEVNILNETFYASNGKWLNALHFLQAEGEYERR